MCKSQARCAAAEKALQAEPEEPEPDFRDVRLQTGPEEKGITAFMPPQNSHITPAPPPVEDYQALNSL